MNRTNRASDTIDRVDKNMDFYNGLIDDQNRQIINEIHWLQDNYDNSQALRAYFLRILADKGIGNKYLYLECINRYGIEELQRIADYRANQLHIWYCNNERWKVDNSGLKPIAELLRMMGR